MPPTSVGPIERRSVRGEAAARLGLGLLIAGLGISAAGCASDALEGPLATNAAAAARGEAFAERNCGACHGLGAVGASSFLGAPPFRGMRFDFNAISYGRALARGHLAAVGMPPAEMSQQDLADVGAYVRSLEHRARR